MPYNVFISYSTKDFKTVEHVKQLLAGSGSEVFVAEHSTPPGRSLAESISNAIKKCDMFILLCSKKFKGVRMGCPRNWYGNIRKQNDNSRCL